MKNDFLHYFLKLNPPRQSFMMDMTEDEKQIMMKHVARVKPLRMASYEGCYQAKVNEWK